MTDIVSASITIDAPPDTVFAILADPRQHARIDGSGSVQEITTGPARLHLGAKFGMEMKLFGLPYSISNRVVEFEEGRRIAWRHVGPAPLALRAGADTRGRHPRHRVVGPDVLPRPDGAAADPARLPRAQPGRHRGHAAQAEGGRRGRRRLSPGCATAAVLLY